MEAQARIHEARTKSLQEQIQSVKWLVFSLVIGGAMIARFARLIRDVLSGT